MDLTAEKTEINQLSVEELRKFGRDEILNLVSTGLLEEDRADEVRLADEQEKQGQQEQTAILQRARAKDQKEERQEDADWLQRMSRSYQLAFQQLMETYEDAEGEYLSIDGRSEKLKADLRHNIDRAYTHGIVTPDGTVAFYARADDKFVDANLQPLQREDGKAAAEKFKSLSPNEQAANACYVDSCNEFMDAEAIHTAAKSQAAQTLRDKHAAQSSDGALSEEELAHKTADSRTQVESLSTRMNKAENAEANFAAVLDTADGGGGNPASNQASFANMVDPANALSNGNGKTSASFNVAADMGASGKVVNSLPVPANRLTFTPAP
jgi:hypothetical protein